MNRFTLELEDRFRHHRVCRDLLSKYQLWTEPSSPMPDEQSLAQSIARLCGAARLAPDDRAMRRIEERIQERVSVLDPSKVDWNEFAPQINDHRLPKAVVLKPWISDREKGVVFISFEYQWIRVIAQKDLSAFAALYNLVLSPSWSPPHSVITCAFPKIYPDPVFCLISNRKDLEIFPRLSPRYTMVPLFASSWVNPEWFQPVPFAKKDIDIFMLANFGKYKRHHVLFKALREMPRSLRVRLNGQVNGNRTADTIRAEARCYGVEDRFELLVNTPDTTVFDSFCRAKISLILSMREGSCVAIVESLFANTPVGIFADAEIGSRVYLNEQTGRFLQHRRLADQLMDFLGHADQYQPRRWAEENRLSCFHSTHVLNEALKQHARATGRDWTQDIAPHHWRPDPLLVSDADRQRLRGAYEEIRDRFGLTIG